MRRPLLLIRLSLAVLLSAEALAQNPVPIQFQTDPVYVQTGTGIVFTVLTTPQTLSMTWQYQTVTLGLWAGGNAVVNPVPQFLGRVTITATQLQIGGAKLQDAGNYTVTVTPVVTTGLTTNARSIQLGVFDAVAGVSLAVPSVATEGGDVSLSCTWTAGTQLAVQWGKDGIAITAGPRITVSGGSLLISPAQRGDAGRYTCTVSNPVSAQTASQSLTVYYGPDTPVLTKQTPNQNQNACVGGGDVLVGLTVGLTCASDSLPPAVYSWQYNGQPVASSQSASGLLTFQTYSTNQSGQYVCAARNSVTGNTSTQGTALAVVGSCLNVGQVVGIVIGSLLLIIILVLLIVLIVCCAKKRRAAPREELPAAVQKSDPRTSPPDPQPNGAGASGRGADPPLHGSNTHAALPRHAGHPRTQISNARRDYGPLHNVQTTDSNPHNGADSSAFVQNANAPQQSPNIVIETGGAPDGARLPAVHVNLTQQRGSGQIHLNLHSYPSDGRASRARLPPPAGEPEDAGHRQQPRLPLRASAGADAGHRQQPGPNRRHADTQTYRQETPRSRSDGTSAPRQQMSWDLLRGTPSYPGGSRERGQSSPDDSDATDCTTRPPIRGSRVGVVDRSRSAESLGLGPRSAAQPEAARRTPRGGERRDAEAPPGSRPTPGQEAPPSGSPLAPPLVERPAVSRDPTRQQGPTSSRGADPRASADPNHLPLAAEHQRAAAGLGAQPAPHDPARLLLTQASVEAQTRRTQQTQAALPHPGPQAPAPIAGVQTPPTPPPAIPLEQFRTLPKERTHHSSPARGLRPPRHAADAPQGPRVATQRHHPAAHVGANRRPPGPGQAPPRPRTGDPSPGQAPPAHVAHHQQQARRGRPRR